MASKRFSSIQVHGRWRPHLATWTRTFLGLALLSGCFDVNAVDPPRQLIWQAADIVAFESEEEDPIPFSASVAMITTGTQTELGFGIVEADPGVEFGWRIRLGRCSGSGSPLTTEPQAFPAITTNEVGEASVTVTLGGSASETEEYAAEVYLEAELVGCGDMVLQ